MKLQLPMYSTKETHDYFHNTFSKYYCADFSAVKNIAARILTERRFSSKSEAVKFIMQNLELPPGKLHYHYQTVYQFVHHFYRTN